MSVEIPNHHCPGCGISLTAFPRYAWHFCNGCLKLAADEAGNRLEFGNASLSGGLVWRYAGDEEWRDAGAVACRIKSRPVMVTEARFGGVVAEPLRKSRFHNRKNTIDLR